jgi:CHAT domain-containing protein
MVPDEKTDHSGSFTSFRNATRIPNLRSCLCAVWPRTPDEVYHLAVGMQFTGFNGMLGMLWWVDDSIAHEVVTYFYREMFESPILNPRRRR